MAEYTCNVCGTGVANVIGLSAHRLSRPCLAERNARDARARGLVRAYPHHVMLKSLGVVERLGTRYVPGGPGKRAKLVLQPWAPASLIALAEELRAGGADRRTRRTLLGAAVERWRRTPRGAEEEEAVS